VLRAEADALIDLARSLDERFERCVEMIAATRGRVVVTGMGKSGHVGRKIAATFASTGTPALYVHPGEASHGDLGMITASDLVLALSNSGETPELADIVAYTRRVSVPLLAIVGRADSPLADTADLALILPRHAEACPMGLAPTTSTTATLALGDALAIAVLERRGMTVEPAGQSDLQLHDLHSFDGRLLGIGSVLASFLDATPQRGATTIYDFVDQANFAWVRTNQGALSPATQVRNVGALGKQRTSVTVQDVAAGLGIVCEVFDVLLGSGNRSVVHVFDPEKDATIFMADFTSRSLPRVVFCGGVFFVTDPGHR
jgi:D-arabinose 5-phosphate isomerase GutQ